MSSGEDEKRYPRSMRHKQILDEAAEHPDASMEELASRVPSATTELVERTLDEYGDPASEDDQSADDETAADEPTADSMGEPPSDPTTAETPDTGTPMTDGSTATVPQSEASTTTETESLAADSPDAATTDEEPEGDTESNQPTRSDLSAKEIEVLRLIADRPTATQREIGDELGVSSATVNNRVNSIAGFEWSERVAFANSVLDADVAEGDSGDQPDPTASTAVEPMLADVLTQLETLDDRIEAVEDCLETLDACPEEETTGGDGTLSAVDEPELVHKAICACLESDRFSEAEELQLVREMLE